MTRAASEVLDALHDYPWPGNVRELENAIERAVVLAEGQPRIELGDLPLEVRAPTAGASAAGEGQARTLAEVERRHILAMLERLAGNRAATARVLGISENTLWRRLKMYGVPGAR